MSFIGYARVSTDDQTTRQQLDALTAAVCVQIFEDVISGASTERDGLDACLAALDSGDGARAMIDLRERNSLSSDDLCYTPAEVMRLLKLSRCQTYERLRSGEIPFKRIGNLYRIPRRALEAWLERVDQRRGKDPKKWTLRFDAERVGGKRKQQSVPFYGTKRDAEAELRRLCGEVDDGRFVKGRETVGDFLDLWLDRIKARVMIESGVDRDRSPNT